jgi:predicted nucleic acid-binding protein
MTNYAERALSVDPQWVAPLLWRSEFRSILAGYLRRGLLDATAAARCLEGAETQFNGFEYLVPSEIVMSKVSCSSCSAYDCEYVALADDLGAELVTSDQQILNQFPDMAVSLERFAKPGSR